MYSQVQVAYNSTAKTCYLQNRSVPEGSPCLYFSDCSSSENGGLTCDSFKNVCARGFNALCTTSSECATGFKCYSGLCQCVLNIYINILLIIIKANNFSYSIYRIQ